MENSHFFFVCKLYSLQVTVKSNKKRRSKVSSNVPVAYKNVDSSWKFVTDFSALLISLFYQHILNNQEKQQKPKTMTEVINGSFYSKMSSCNQCNCMLL